MLLCFLLFSACRYSAFLNFNAFDSPNAEYIGGPKGVPVLEIPIQGPASKARAEFSGLEWYGDTLVLLPQYPSRFFGGPDGALVTLTKDDIIRYLDEKETAALVPGYIPFYAPGINQIKGYEGFEAIAIKGETVFFTIETHVGLWRSMKGYLVSGRISPDLTSIVVDIENKVELLPLSDLINLSHEALLVYGDEIITFYEGNGVSVTPNPVAYRYDMAFKELPSLSFPNIEYRITDVTTPDADSKFWAINYFFPGDIWLKNDKDSLVTIYGDQLAHLHNESVERIVEFQIFDNEIILSKQNPIRIELAESGKSRNWEGIVRLDDRGFLMVTDKIPTTMLGFIPWNESSN